MMGGTFFHSLKDFLTFQVKFSGDNYYKVLLMWALNNGFTIPDKKYPLFYMVDKEGTPQVGGLRMAYELDNKEIATCSVSMTALSLLLDSCTSSSYNALMRIDKHAASGVTGSYMVSVKQGVRSGWWSTMTNDCISEELNYMRSDFSQTLRDLFHQAGKVYIYVPYVIAKEIDFEDKYKVTTKVSLYDYCF